MFTIVCGGKIKLRICLYDASTAVEWLFWEVISYFQCLDFKKNLKIGLSQVCKMYIVCSIMQNALTCLYGNGTSQFFDLDPPSVEDYFA